MGGLTAGTVMAEGTFSLCERRLRAKVGYCVPAQVPPFSEAPTFDLHLIGRPQLPPKGGHILRAPNEICLCCS